MTTSTYLETCNEKQFYHTSEVTYKISATFYSFIVIVGVPENVVALYFLMCNKKELTEAKIYMISLTVADLLFVIFLPFWIDYYYREGDWIFSSVACSLWGSLFYINTYNTIFFLAVISFTRYRAVSQPVKVVQSRQIVRGLALTALIWTLTICFSLPIVINHEDYLVKTNTSHERCFESYGEKNKSQIIVIHMLMELGFVVSFGVVAANNVLILRTLSVDQKTLRTSQNKFKTRAFRLVLMVLIIYTVSFLPYHLVHLLWTLLVLNFWKSDDCAFRKTVNDAHHISLCLMCTNCILDPILYCFMTTNFRQYFKELRQSFTRKYILRRNPKPQEIQLA
ncbi:platelet-activating factor receptor-like [Rhincodon typus]|uniref:platelet-activating factor receptor-like n=1 Tax=Rhincodon typus TaxID=259920 RepID=UPI0009A3D019|nr:platelet-activating factor receptor-like [Rhincodon typus]XP_048456578.1 platelet-activating factor receptor-like [Rhincodon typus]